ncbi:putative transposon-encoded protein [Rhodobium orientis]|uniref:Uncharacterized protein n=1 Tax=Rhodobium orientis TaxID=34017 RepID=A0A327JIK9_9HYPH|nr:hypothetical protein [Rhodobium orientis]MBB4302864.1 putative transposon-encoded protein [Rhodobium orientis]RAI26237.1 hypothetical protein CH339_14720 [Rhodobium orientis]
MIWQNYVFRKGSAVEDLWDEIYNDKKSDDSKFQLLYIAGLGFDVRAVDVLRKFVERLAASEIPIETATLLLVEFPNYNLDDELKEITQENGANFEEIFKSIGKVRSISVGAPEVDDDISSTMALTQGVRQMLDSLECITDLVIDVSSLPRIVYLSVLLSVLARVVPVKNGDCSLASEVTVQVLVAEDPALDGKISAEDPANELVFVPGYSEAFQSETLSDLPMVWFPILGENRLGQVLRIERKVPTWAEICPVLPHPSSDPRRGDRLLLEYDDALFSKRQTPIGNIIYAHEGHPFEAYRQLLEAMQRYRDSLGVIGDSRLIVTPLSSKLITIGCALACFEAKVTSTGEGSSVAIPYAEPKRYVADPVVLRNTRPDLCALVLTGDPYRA